MDFRPLHVPIFSLGAALIKENFKKKTCFNTKSLFFATFKVLGNRAHALRLYCRTKKGLKEIEEDLEKETSERYFEQTLYLKRYD